jgi:hypothetical protein
MLVVAAPHATLVSSGTASMLGRLQHLLHRESDQEARELRTELEHIKMLQAIDLVWQLRNAPPPSRLRDVEFKVFSQFGDDGILQYLIHTVPDLPDTCVEFGVEDYREANTRFLVTHDNWRGVVLDGDKGNVEAIRRDPIYALHELRAACVFVDADNINTVLRGAGASARIGLLSIDIDGNDYWVWRAIDCVDPVIVVAEYNSVLGAKRPVSIPYDASFVRSRAHHSFLYFGCSLPALCHLASSKGYAFVGSNSTGLNAYFVKRGHLGALKERTIDEEYVESRFRESRDERGHLSYATGPERRRVIASMPLVDVVTGEHLTVGDLD